MRSKVLDRLTIYPKSHFVMPRPRIEAAVETIKDGACRMGNLARTAGPAARSAARSSADAVRYGDDQGSRLLPRHRELLAPLYRPHAGPAAADAARLPAAGFVDVHRREPSDDAAASRHVSRRSLAKRKSGRVRIPSALRAGQSSADVRRVREADESAHLCFGDAGSVRTDQDRRRRRGTGDPADRPHRSGGRGAAGSRPDRRSACTRSACARRRTNAFW